MSPVCVPSRAALVGTVAAGTAGVFGAVTGHVGMGIVGGLGELAVAGILVAVWPTDSRPEVEVSETGPADPIGAEPYPVVHMLEGPRRPAGDGSTEVAKPRRHLKVVA